MRFFFSPNATRAIKANGLKFQFEAVDNVGGVWSGVFSTNVEAEAAALAGAKDQGVKEITAEEFAAYLDVKKKVRPSRSVRLAEHQPPLLDSRINNAPALLVEDPKAAGLPSSSTGVAVATNPKVESVDDVLKVAKVVPPEPAAKTKKTRRGTTNGHE